jgi:hypothetical protein
MKAQALKQLDNIKIEETKNGRYVRLRKNVETKTVTEEGSEKSATVYEYDEVVFKLDDSKLDDSYVSKNFDSLFSTYKQKEYDNKIEKIKWYLDKGWLKESEMDYYESAGIINSKDDVLTTEKVVTK